MKVLILLANHSIRWEVRMDKRPIGISIWWVETGEKLVKGDRCVAKVHDLGIKA
jgi:hypothetical protein